MDKSGARLAWPLAVSLALHLGAGWLFSSATTEFLPRRAKAVALTVSLAARERPDPQPIAPQKVTPAATPAPASSTASPEVAGKLTQKARVLVAPDLTALEDIQVPNSGSLTLRLHVSALGTVERVTVVKGDPIPKELLDGLLSSFKSARLAPAMAGTEPVASALDLVIRYDAGPVPLWRDQ